MPLIEQPAEEVERVVRTNLVGTLLASRAAMAHMSVQPGGGHIFNLEGAGSDGSATPRVSEPGASGRAAGKRLTWGTSAATCRCPALYPPPPSLDLIPPPLPTFSPLPAAVCQYVAYGATKAAIAQLLGSLRLEAAALAREAPAGAGRVRVHSLQPGMVLTDLLLQGATLRSKQVRDAVGSPLDWTTKDAWLALLGSSVARYPLIDCLPPPLTDKLYRPLTS